MIHNEIIKLVTGVNQSPLPLKTMCWPFFGYKGPLYDSAPIKVMIVGKATYGWGQDPGDNLYIYKQDKGNESVALQLPSQFIEGKIIPYYSGETGYHSSFWRRIYQLCLCLLQKDSTELRRDHRAEEMFKSIYWTNRFKLGSVCGNPSIEIEKYLLKHDNVLEEEIDILRPDVIVFSTGHAYDKFFTGIFRVEKEFNGFAKVRLKSPNIIAVRSMHFQALSNDQFNNMAQFLNESIGRK